MSLIGLPSPSVRARHHDDLLSYLSFVMSLGSPTLVKQSNRKRSQLHRATIVVVAVDKSRDQNQWQTGFWTCSVIMVLLPGCDLSMTSRTAVMKMHSHFYSVLIQSNSRLGPRSKLRHKLGDTIFSTITLGNGQSQTRRREASANHVLSAAADPYKRRFGSKMSSIVGARGRRTYRQMSD